VRLRKRCFDEKTYIGSYCVSTVELIFKHYGGMWYETYIFPADGEEITGWLEVWGERYATRDEAVAGHARVCDDLRNGRLTTSDDEVLTP
jgi:hypothetical protein